LVLLSVLGWSLVATASSQAARPMAGPATTVTVQLAPASIVADGSSTTDATATVTDAMGLPVSGDIVNFTDPSGNTVSGVDQGNGVYTATLTSSTTAGTVTITASDTTAGVSGTATLIQTPGPATNVSVQLTPSSSIVANGTATTTAIATVTDFFNNPVPGETVDITTSDPGVGVSPTPAHDNGDGTYTATITSSTTVGPVTVTATDGSLPPAQTTLTQTAGPATQVSVSLHPASIPADGSSQTTATATVTDAQFHPISGDPVVFVPSDPGDTVGPITDNLDGTYTATITSSSTPGAVQVVAVDQTTGANGQTTLNQTAAPSATAINVVPAQPVTNQTVTMVATVTASFGSPAGTVAFRDGGSPISGCDNVSVTAVGSSAANATCQTSFAAANSPVAVTAAFTPSGGSNVGGSTSSPADLLSVGQDSTTTNLTASSANPTAGSTVTYLAAVVPKHGGPTQPSGSIQFSDGTHTLSGCSSQPLLHGSSSSGAAAAVCQVSFGAVGPRVITAHYLGDASFTGSDSPSAQTVVHKRPAPQRLSSSLQWTFFFTPTYTNVLSLLAHGVPAGASVQVKCRGQGCPYGKRTIVVSNAKPCKTTPTRHCTKLPSSTVDLLAAFRHHRLKVGAKVTVEVLRPAWIGRYYRFTMRSGRAPRTRISCLAPGAPRPGVGC
jgi:adhesin/invasin